MRHFPRPLFFHIFYCMIMTFLRQFDVIVFFYKAHG